jgi:hypothetical protein
MLRRIVQWWRMTWADVDELEQRRRLMAEPWREEFLHRGWDGRVHGRFVPPVESDRFSVTGRGWCVAVLEDSARPDNAKGCS